MRPMEWKASNQAADAHDYENKDEHMLHVSSGSRTRGRPPKMKVASLKIFELNGIVGVEGSDAGMELIPKVEMFL